MSSHTMTFVEAVKARLEGWVPLGDTPVVMDRTADLLASIQKAVAKMKTVICIYPTRGRRPENARVTDAFATTFFVEIYSNPVTKGDALSADAAMEAVVAALDGWAWSGDLTGHANGTVVVRGWDLVPDPEFFVWRVECTQQLYLSVV